MRVSLLVYGVVYVVIELIGAALEDVGWGRITALDVATAVTDACLTVAIGLAALLAAKLPTQRWGGTARDWWHSIGHPDVVWDDEPIGVRSWRPAPLELSSEPAEVPTTRSTYAGNPYTFAGHRWPADRGRQL